MRGPPHRLAGSLLQRGDGAVAGGEHEAIAGRRRERRGEHRFPLHEAAVQIDRLELAAFERHVRELLIEAGRRRGHRVEDDGPARIERDDPIRRLLVGTRRLHRRRRAGQRDQRCQDEQRPRSFAPSVAAAESC